MKSSNFQKKPHISLLTPCRLDAIATHSEVEIHIARADGSIAVVSLSSEEAKLFAQRLILAANIID